MNRSSRVGIGWSYAKKYFLAVVTVFLMRVGLGQVLSTLIYPLTGGALHAINFIIRRGFPDHLLLNEYYSGVPWTYHVRIAAEGVITLVIALFLGLWANARAQRRQKSTQEEAPALGEG